MRKLWPKYENWSKLRTEQQLYRYNPKLYRYNLAKNDQKRKCTGTSSNCTGTSHPKCPKMCVFSHFSICFNPNQLYTPYTPQNHFKFILYPQLYSIYHSILLLFQRPIMNFFKNHSNMGLNPYTYQIHKFIRVCSNPTPLLCN